MLWFNASKDVGVLRTEAGERIDVMGSAFATGEKPVGRCAGKSIRFDSVDGVPSAVTFVCEPAPRRARLRGRR
jgi:hypothetical protein